MVENPVVQSTILQIQPTIYKFSLIRMELTKYRIQSHYLGEEYAETQTHRAEDASGALQRHRGEFSQVHRRHSSDEA